MVVVVEEGEEEEEEIDAVYMVLKSSVSCG